MNTSNTTATTPPTGTPPLLRQLHRRDRSRSRERLPLTTPSHPNLTTHPRQPLNNITPAAGGHRGHLHHALWTASTTPTADLSVTGFSSHSPDKARTELSFTSNTLSRKMKQAFLRLAAFNVLHSFTHSISSRSHLISHSFFAHYHPDTSSISWSTSRQIGTLAHQC